MLCWLIRNANIFANCKEFTGPRHVETNVCVEAFAVSGECKRNSEWDRERVRDLSEARTCLHCEKNMGILIILNYFFLLIIQFVEYLALSTKRKTAKVEYNYNVL